LESPRKISEKYFSTWRSPGTKRGWEDWEGSERIGEFEVGLGGFLILSKKKTLNLQNLS